MVAWTRRDRTHDAELFDKLLSNANGCVESALAEKEIKESRAKGLVHLREFSQIVQLDVRHTASGAESAFQTQWIHGESLKSKILKDCNN